MAELSCNTLNTWAAQICDTLTLGLITEAIALGLPIVAVEWA